MKRSVKTSEYFKNPQNMTRIVRENAVASSAFEGASAQAIRLSNGDDAHRRRIAASKKRASGS